MKREFSLLTLLALLGLIGLFLSPRVTQVSSSTGSRTDARNRDGRDRHRDDDDDDDDDDHDIPQQIVRQGLRIAPVPLDYRRKNRDLVGLGSYIVNAQGGCNDCHTNPPYTPGGNPFNGDEEQINVPCYLSGGVEFGPFTSRNLTPNAQGLPAGLTFQQFRETLRTGRDFKSPFNPPFDNGLLQVMPWPVYGKMINRDLRAVYEYLKAIPSRPRCSTPPAPAP
jgi:hypothetical protein